MSFIITPQTVLYFGCLHDSGHYLFHPKGGEFRWLDYKIQPWGVRIDGGIFKDSRHSNHAGVIHYDIKDGWTGVAWADYSVDTRPGSHSTFIVNAIMDQSDLIALAQKQWPQVFSRPKFPKLITLI